ncbi:MAG TPA: PAS domain-containing protein, partial [Polyangiaceae bacterium]|nr:PAS domain-containing protein [Polyangiaceae bacterium]
MESGGRDASDLGEPSALFGGDGGVATAARSLDWSRRALGPVEGWPPLLRSFVQLALDSPHAAVVLWGRDALVFANDRAARMFSEDLGEVLGRSWFDFSTRGSDDARALYARVLNGETVHERGRNLAVVDRGRTEEAWFDLEYTPIRGADGRVAGVLHLARERTDEFMTSRQHAFLARLSDALAPLVEPFQVEEVATRLLGAELGVARVMYGVVASDDEHIHFARSYVAPGVPEILGSFRMTDFGQRAVAALRAGKSLVSDSIDSDEALTPTERDAYLRLGIQALAGVPLVKDSRLVANISVHDVKPRRWTRHELELIAETAQRTWSAVERARAEAALRASEERYRSLFETMQEGYVLYELVRDESGVVVDARFLEINPAFAAVTGVPRERCIGRLRSEVLPRPTELAPPALVRALERGESFRFEAYAPTVGRWYDIRVHPESHDRIVVLYDDVTARKQAEHTLRETDARNAYLLELSDRLRAASDPIEIQDVATALLAERLNAVRCYYSEFDFARGTAEVRTESVRGNAASVVGTYRLTDFHGHIAAL